MCMGRNFGGPLYGIPIPHEIHERFPEEIKNAWETFNDWWQNVLADGNPISRKNIPENIVEAYEIMKAAPIPEHDGATGADSCYVYGVEMRLVD